MKIVSPRFLSVVPENDQEKNETVILKKKFVLLNFINFFFIIKLY